ncbi:hypothetical protein [Actinomadura madurae]|nr:hypothetical protein [Actinomadura madurae]
MSSASANSSRARRVSPSPAASHPSPTSAEPRTPAAMNRSDE